MRRRRLLWGLFGLWLVLWAGQAFSSGPELVASQYSDRYHRISCKVAQKIRSQDRVYYNTPEEALAAGLDPCKKCDPPEQSGRS